MRECVNIRAVGDLHPGAENDMRLNQDISAQLCVGAEKNRLRRDQRGSVDHSGLAQPVLRDAFRPRELGAVVDAEHLALRADDNPRLQSLRARKLNDIREVIFALGVVGANVPQQFQRAPPVDRHQSGVA